LLLTFTVSSITLNISVTRCSAKTSSTFLSTYFRLSFIRALSVRPLNAALNSLTIIWRSKPRSINNLVASSSVLDALSISSLIFIGSSIISLLISASNSWLVLSKRGWFSDCFVMIASNSFWAFLTSASASPLDLRIALRFNSKSWSAVFSSGVKALSALLALSLILRVAFLFSV